jgi:hypothetical protein
LKEAGEEAALRIICLPETLTSQRQNKTIESLFWHPLRGGHTTHFATVGGGLVGGLIVIRCMTTLLQFTSHVHEASVYRFAE